MRAGWARTSRTARTRRTRLGGLLLPKRSVGLERIWWAAGWLDLAAAGVGIGVRRGSVDVGLGYVSAEVGEDVLDLSAVDPADLVVIVLG